MPVFNLRVAESHTYFVASDGGSPVLVHNASKEGMKNANAGPLARPGRRRSGYDSNSKSKAPSVEGAASVLKSKLSASSKRGNQATPPQPPTSLRGATDGFVRRVAAAPGLDGRLRTADDSPNAVHGRVASPYKCGRRAGARREPPRCC